MRARVRALRKMLSASCAGSAVRHRHRRRCAVSTANSRTGCFVAPTVGERGARRYRCGARRLFVPHRAGGRGRHRSRKRIERANASDYGLTAGFYGARDEIEAISSNAIEAGVTYVEPPAGRHDRRVARLSAVRRLEGQRLDRQGDRIVLVPAAVHARAKPDHSGVEEQRRSGRGGSRRPDGLAVIKAA